MVITSKVSSEVVELPDEVAGRITSTTRRLIRDIIVLASRLSGMKIIISDITNRGKSCIITAGNQVTNDILSRLMINMNNSTVERIDTLIKVTQK